MKVLYKVKYEVREVIDGDEKTAEWRRQDPVTVLADDDARSAVAKLEKKVGSLSFKWDDDEGAEHETKNVGFRLVSVENLYDVEYP